MRISPSKLQPWSLCPAFAYVERLGTNTAAEEGKRLHSAVETGDSDGLNEEERDLVEKLQQLKMVLRGEFPGDVVEYSELPLSIHGPWGTMKGTADHLLYSCTAKRAVLSDWKMGRLGIPSSAQDSYQLRAYALGYLQGHHPASRPDTIDVQMVAPRTNELDRYTYHAADMDSMVASIEHVIEAVEDPFKKPNNSDPELCARCGNSHRCPAMSTSVTAWAPQVAAEYSDLAEVVAPVEQMTPVGMSKFLAISAALDEWREQKKKKVLERVLGERLEVPGYKVVSRAGTPRFDDCAVVGARLMSEHGKTLQEVLQCATLKVSAVREILPETDSAFADIITRGSDVRYLQRSRK